MRAQLSLASCACACACAFSLVALGWGGADGTAEQAAVLPATAQAWARSDGGAAAGHWNASLTAAELGEVAALGLLLHDEVPLDAHKLLLLGNVRHPTPNVVVAAANHLSASLIKALPLGATGLLRHVLYAGVALLVARLSAADAGSRRVAAAMQNLRDAFVSAHHRRLGELRRTHPAPAFVGRRTPVYFLHISKSGGSTVCSIARSRNDSKNGCVAVRDKSPCWVKGTGPQWENTRKHDSLGCEATEALYAEHNISWLSNEGFLGGRTVKPLESLCTGRLMYMTMLRNPFMRTHSHSQHREVDVLNKQAVNNAPFHTLSVGQKMIAHPPIFDNYMTRVLLGEGVYNLARGQLNATHLQAAKMQLARFDLVLSLEAGLLRPALLRNMFKWADTDFDGQAMRRRGHKKRGYQAGNTTLEEWGLIIQQNMLDYRLWQFGTTLTRLEAAIFKDPEAGERRSGEVAC